jgi:hypothetical protein
MINVSKLHLIYDINLTSLQQVSACHKEMESFPLRQFYPLPDDVTEMECCQILWNQVSGVKLRKNGMNYLSLSISGNFEEDAFSTMTGILSGNFSMIFSTSSFLLSNGYG